MTEENQICSSYETGNVKAGTLHKECKMSDDAGDSHSLFL